MSTRDDRRQAAVERMAQHLLAHGLPGASLRPLAAAAGTSDRMLLYYFRDKDDLLAATLTHVAGMLTLGLEAAVPAGTRLSPRALLDTVWAATGSEAMRPFMRLWLELAAATARGEQPHQAISVAIMAGFSDWVESRLDLPAAERADAAALVLGVAEGAMFLDALGRRDLADRAVASAF